MKPSCFSRIKAKENDIKAILNQRPFPNSWELVLPMPSKGDHPIDLIKLQHGVHGNKKLTITIEGLKTAKWKW
jgi:hypothetical protein